MNCKRAVKLLPLLAGEDLDPVSRRRAAAHLERCPRCRTAKRDLTEARRWLQSAPSPPLTEDDYATLRRDVWRQIEARGLASKGVSPFPGRLVLSGAGVLAAALAALLIARSGREPFGYKTAKPTPPQIAEALPQTRPQDHAPVSPDVMPPFRPAPGHLRANVPGTDSDVVRIEFRTLNPNVRIIWLVKKGEETSSALTAGRNEEVS